MSVSQGRGVVKESQRGRDNLEQITGIEQVYRPGLSQKLYPFETLEWLRLRFKVKAYEKTTQSYFCVWTPYICSFSF